MQWTSHAGPAGIKVVTQSLFMQASLYGEDSESDCDLSSPLPLCLAYIIHVSVILVARMKQMQYGTVEDRGGRK